MSYFGNYEQTKVVLVGSIHPFCAFFSTPLQPHIRNIFSKWVIQTPGIDGQQSGHPQVLPTLSYLPLCPDRVSFKPHTSLSFTWLQTLMIKDEQSFSRWRTSAQRNRDQITAAISQTRRATL
ncbi:hypothetical protein BaRGS_00035128 [Batillaria attramentaria]|uniref:Uncharacterized protein n=1 Tax=Batillaria attramentaria TaxID=370345 RepID=A0ABD0JFR3_9CAEN